MVGDNLESIFPNARNNFLGFDLSAQQSFAVATAILVLPTVLLRNLSLLSYISGDSCRKSFELSKKSYSDQQALA